MSEEEKREKKKKMDQDRKARKLEDQHVRVSSVMAALVPDTAAYKKLLEELRYVEGDFLGHSFVPEKFRQNKLVCLFYFITSI